MFRYIIQIIYNILKIFAKTKHDKCLSKKYLRQKKKGKKVLREHKMFSSDSNATFFYQSFICHTTSNMCHWINLHCSIYFLLLNKTERSVLFRANDLFVQFWISRLSGFFLFSSSASQCLMKRQTAQNGFDVVSRIVPSSKL